MKPPTEYPACAGCYFNGVAQPEARHAEGGMVGGYGRRHWVREDQPYLTYLVGLLFVRCSFATLV